MGLCNASITEIRYNGIQGSCADERMNVEG